MRMKIGFLSAMLLAAAPLASRAEEIRMIGQSVMFSSKSILSNVIDSRTHRTLIKAIKSVELEQPLMQEGAFTVFAPEDAAFAALPKAYAARLFQRVNRDQMARVLACHIVAGNELAGKRLLDLVAEGEKIQLQTLGECLLTVTRRHGKLIVQGVTGLSATITGADIAQSNGMVQIIDQVIAPPIN